MRSKIIYILYVIVSLFVIIYLVYLHFYTPSPSIEYIEVPKPQYIYKVKKIKIPIKEIETVEKIKVVEKEKLPDWLASATEYVILTVGVVKPHNANTKVISVLNTKTGENKLLFKQEHPPFFTLLRDLSISIDYDLISHNIGGCAKLSFLRISKVYFHTFITGNTNGISAGIGIEVKF